VIPGLRFDNVREHPLKWIWEESEAFRKFRGEDWMPEPCRSCERRTVDFGGCRCQAFLLAGDAAKTDPVCELSHDHGIVLAALNGIDNAALVRLARGADPGAGRLPLPDVPSPRPPLVQPEWLYRRNATKT
jgi:pyrroloquinoline quinone biosynthesis protein E